ncbi:NACHT domain-containing protein [Actinokineospora sp. G85]|uniref:NACHT domain-containing protein n=1 Tax=Actinokineospora sp. G85 TaxID=3406626 RepID=UPI003C70E34A
MRRSLSYSDALRLLGAKDSKIMDLLDLVSAGVVVGSGNFPLLGARAELIKFGRLITTSVEDRLTGCSRLDRTMRLHAAHTVVVITAFLEAVEAAEFPLPTTDLTMTAAESIRLFTREPSAESPRWNDLAQDLVREVFPAPGPVAGIGAFSRELIDSYRRATRSFTAFLSGLKSWEDLDETRREDLEHSLESLPAHAVAMYRQSCVRLAADCVEFAVWTDSFATEHTHAALSDIRERLGRTAVALADLERMFASMPRSAGADGCRAALSAVYRAELERSALDAADIPEQLTVPVLANSYIDPAFRASVASSDALPSQESWWDQRPCRENLSAFMLSYLTSPQSVRAPLAVLGQPGSGKSLFTKVLAARLPPEDFLPVVVSFREIPATLDAQTLIERAVFAAIGERVSWPELVRSHAQALPVVVFDGFDELLQATGSNHADFLVQLADFQERERTLGRPLAVVVTSRIAVTSRARFPDRCLVVRLEPFDMSRVRAWVRVWNTANSDYFRRAGLRPLSDDTLYRNPHLAKQPLLLLMLAVYDATDNGLQTDDWALGRTALYERLLHRFAEREVVRARPGLSADAIAELVEVEFTRLAVTAFAMANRGAQWIAERELNRDLRGLGLDSTAADGPGGLTVGQVVIGRFFFVHETRVFDDPRPLHTYEFLHATFGEYLVARHVVAVLAASTRASDEPGHSRMLDSLLSFSLLCNQSSVVEFIDELLDGLEPHTRSRMVEVVRQEFRGFLVSAAPLGVPDYHPRALPSADRLVYRSANALLLLIVLAGKTTLTDLLGAVPSAVSAWSRLTSRWRAHLEDRDWESFRGSLHVRRVWADDGRRDAVLTLYGGRTSDVDATDDVEWSLGLEQPVDNGQVVVVADLALDQVRWDANILCDPARDVLLHSMGPVHSSALTSMFVVVGDEIRSLANVLACASSAVARGCPIREREALYTQSVQAFSALDEGDRRTQSTLFQSVLLHDVELPSASLFGYLRSLLATGAEITRTTTELALRCLGPDAEVNRECLAVIASRMRDMPGDDEVLAVWVALREAGLVDFARVEEDLFIDETGALGALDLPAISVRQPSLVRRARRLLGSARFAALTAGRRLPARRRMP